MKSDAIWYIKSDEVRKFLKIVFIVFIVVFALLIAVLKPAGRDSYTKSAFYTATLSQLQQVSTPENLERSEFQIGWSDAEILPKKLGTLAGYGPGRNAEYVIDTVKVKIFFLKNTHTQGFIINYELLMVHPELKKRIESALRHENLAFDFIYFTATHTHHGPGGFAPGISGNFVGGYSQEYTDYLVQQTIVAARQASANVLPANMKYNKVPMRGMVINRVSGEDYADNHFHFIRFENSKHEVAYFSSFTAHPTILSSHIKGLSGEYPHAMTQSLEKSKKIEFAMFAAGGVASHGPLSLSNLFSMHKYGKRLSEAILTNRRWLFQQQNMVMHFSNLPIVMPETEFRVGKYFCLRNWVFHFIFKPQTANIQVLQLGKLVLIGYPSDFSGELVPLLNVSSQESPFYPIVTSFNGNYIGYISHPQHYQKNHHEIKDLNWYGFDAGYYFVDISNQLLDKVLVK